MGESGVLAQQVIISVAASHVHSCGRRTAASAAQSVHSAIFALLTRSSAGKKKSSCGARLCTPHVASVASSDFADAIVEAIAGALVEIHYLLGLCLDVSELVKVTLEIW